MNDNRELINSISIATPCPADWNKMEGDNRMRFCGQCKLNVYNLSAMTVEEGAALIQKTSGRLCVQLYRRADGTVLTQDCPVGIRHRIVKMWVRGTALVASLFIGILHAKEKKTIECERPIDGQHWKGEAQIRIGGMIASKREMGDMVIETSTSTAPALGNPILKKEIKKR